MSFNVFAPTRTLLHTYNRHDHHDHDHDHDHHHHHLLHHLHEGSKFATPYEQYFDWGNSIKYIFMRDQNLPPYEQYVDRRNNINFIFMRDQNSPPPMNNMLVGVITSTLSS